MHITDIIVPERHRKAYANIDKLAISISQLGLFNPIVLTQDKHLNQGGRRLSALRMIYELNKIPEEVPEELQTILECQDENIKSGELLEGIHYKVMQIENRYLELICEHEENFQREPLTWQERASLIKAIHNEHQRIYGKKNSVRDGWGTRDTAKLIGVSAATISHELRIAEALETPESDIANCKDRASALKKILEQAENAVVAELRKRKAKALQQFSLEHNLTNMDAIKALQTYKLGSFNHCITDPPYAIEFDKLTEGKSESNHYIEMSTEEYIPYMTQFAQEVFARMYSGYFICFCAHQHFHELAKVISEAGFTVSTVPLIWYKKGSPGKNHHPDKQLTSITEFAVVAWKGVPELAQQGKTNIFECKSYIDVKERFHITQKPVELMQAIIEVFTQPADIVADFFIGSGATIKACIASGRGFIGNDKSEYFEETKMSIMDFKENCTRKSTAKS
jgi:site-specific DNA-methyltransferase (adenine-specific)